MPSRPVVSVRLSIVLGLLMALLALAGCAAGPRGAATSAALGVSAVESEQDLRRVTDINHQLLVRAAQNMHRDLGDYRVGPEDLLEIEVFQVPEFSRQVRVDAMGRISLPLVGDFAVSGLTVPEVRDLLTRELGARYLRNPQISVSVVEYRSLQFTVIGSVNAPQIYSVNRPVTLTEALGMAGGLKPEAGGRIFVTDRVRDPETGAFGTRNLIVELEELLSDAGGADVLLGVNAVVNVPTAGIVYMEGAIARPGILNLRAETTILTAVAMSGGLTFEASPSDVRLMRRDAAGNWETRRFNYNTIRDNPDTDVLLQDGDVLLFGFNSAKRAVRNLNSLLPGAAFFMLF